MDARQRKPKRITEELVTLREEEVGNNNATFGRNAATETNKENVHFDESLARREEEGNTRKGAAEPQVVQTEKHPVKRRET